MTLVIGIPCNDGFVLSADSQESWGTKNNVRKIRVVDGDHVLVIGMSGDSVHANAGADLVEEAFRDRRVKDVGEAGKLLRKTLRAFYFGLPEFLGAKPHMSDVEYVIGYRDKRGITRVFRSFNGSVHVVRGFCAIGEGARIANQIAYRVFNRFGTLTIDTAVARHWIRQITCEGRIAPSVGGGIHTWSVREIVSGGEKEPSPFFEVHETKDQDKYLWGTQQRLFWAIENALGGHQDAALGHLERIAATLKEIVSTRERSLGNEETVKNDYDRPPAGYGLF